MRGALHAIIRRFKIGLVLATCLFLGAFHPYHVEAADGLDLAHDTVATILPDITGIYHSIYFTLPVDAQQVTITDYLLITLTNYTKVDASGVFLSGGYGSPIVIQQGNEIQITNFLLLPGTGLTVNGINATNPDLGKNNQVLVQISGDQAGQTVRNQASIVPSDAGSSITAVTATIQTQTAALNISGFTSPNTFTTLSEGTAVISTTISDNSGFFSFSDGGLAPGNHSYQIYSTDSLSRSSSQASLNLFLLGNSITSATGILLSPSISLDKAQIQSGDTLTISGSAKPNSQINIFLESPLRSYTATSDSSGNWSYLVPSSETTAMTPGSYRVYALTQDSDGNQSIVSPTVNFEVITNNDTGSNPPPACDISHGDLNCDGKTNLTDFSILLFHWNTNHKVADINKDGTVNLIDFSIMMFYYSN